jgi:hypothetical protein
VGEVIRKLYIEAMRVGKNRLGEARIKKARIRIRKAGTR